MFFFPLFDNNPTKDRPIVSWIIIFLCIIVYMWQITLSDFEQNNFFKIWNNTFNIVWNLIIAFRNLFYISNIDNFYIDVSSWKHYAFII